MEQSKKDLQNAENEAQRAEIARPSKETTEANARAAEANAIAERERLARLQLEARLAPRSLTQAQQDDLRDRLRPHGAHDLDVLIYGDTPEIVGIASLVIGSITAANWNVRGWSVLPGGMAVTGILVSTRSGSDHVTEAVAGALVSALSAQALDARRWQQFATGDLPGALTGPPWDTSRVAPIRVLIGTKP